MQFRGGQRAVVRRLSVGEEAEGLGLTKQERRGSRSIMSEITVVSCRIPGRGMAFVDGEFVEG